MDMKFRKWSAEGIEGFEELLTSFERLGGTGPEVVTAGATAEGAAAPEHRARDKAHSHALAICPGRLSLGPF